MIAYQRALAAALARPSAVPGVAPGSVASFAAAALRKRLSAVRAYLPATLAVLGRAGFDASYGTFSARRGACGPGGYRDEAIAFARSLRVPVAEREARMLRATAGGAAFAITLGGETPTVIVRPWRGARLCVLRLSLPRPR